MGPTLFQYPDTGGGTNRGDTSRKPHAPESRRKRRAFGKFMKLSHFHLTGKLPPFTISKDNFEKPPCFFAVLSVYSPLRGPVSI